MASRGSPRAGGPPDRGWGALSLPGAHWGLPTLLPRVERGPLEDPDAGPHSTAPGAEPMAAGEPEQTQETA